MYQEPVASPYGALAIVDLPGAGANRAASARESNSVKRQPGN